MARDLNNNKKCPITLISVLGGGFYSHNIMAAHYKCGKGGGYNENYKAYIRLIL